MIKEIKAHDSDPLFKLPGGKVITHLQFQSKLKDLIDRIGMNADNFSTHSFRRGGTSFAFRSKVPVDLIKAHGDWKSDCYQRYLSFSLQDKMLVVGKMRENILAIP